MFVENTQVGGIGILFRFHPCSCNPEWMGRLIIIPFVSAQGYLSFGVYRRGNLLKW